MRFEHGFDVDQDLVRTGKMSHLLFLVEEFSKQLQGFLSVLGLHLFKRFLGAEFHRGIRSSSHPSIKFGKVDDFIVPDLFDKVQFLTGNKFHFDFFLKFEKIVEEALSVFHGVGASAD